MSNFISDPTQVTEDGFHLEIKGNFDKWIKYLSSSKFKPSVVEGKGCQKMIELLNCLDKLDLLVLNEFHETFVKSRGKSFKIKTVIDKVELVSDDFDTRWFEIECNSMKIELTDGELHYLGGFTNVMNPNPHVISLELIDRSEGINVKTMKTKFPNVLHFKANNIWIGHGHFIEGYETVDIEAINPEEYLDILNCQSIKSFKCIVTHGTDVLPTCEYYEITFNGGEGPTVKSVSSTLLSDLVEEK